MNIISFLSKALLSVLILLFLVVIGFPKKNGSTKMGGKLRALNFSSWEAWRSVGNHTKDNGSQTSSLN